MSNKQIIKEVFDKKFDKKKMKEQILLNYERKEKNKMIKYLKYALPVCALAVACGIFFWQNNPSSKESLVPVRYNSNIVINKMDAMGASLLDADIKTVNENGFNIPNIESLINIVLPKDLNQFDGYGIFTRSDKTGEYDKLNSYVHNYYQGDGLRSIRIAFSDTNKPIRDYYFDEEGAEVSTINNTKLTIFQYEEIYFTEFKYQGYNFDIETSNVTIEELTALLNSIIKE